MSTEIAKLEAPPVTAEQLELVKRTVASGATDAELKLYLYDCARQGVHPLDRLLHFTKRGGKYTPVTSIDLMRIRAAETGEYAGSDDAMFQEQPGGMPPAAALVIVWRIVQGGRYPFSATARWQEYCPPAGQDHMWRKMPFTMLAKCAEALALRKGFPRQLAGLYAHEEMDQAGLSLPAEPAPVRPPEPPQSHPAAAPDVLDTELPPAPVISEAQQKRLFAIARQAGWTTEALKAWLLSRGILSTKDIAKGDYNGLITAIEKGPESVPQMPTAEEIF